MGWGQEGGAEILIIRCLEFGDDVLIATHSSLTGSLVEVYNAGNTKFIALKTVFKAFCLFISSYIPPSTDLSTYL